jgi:dTDP-glucose pyrophosphorylase
MAGSGHRFKTEGYKEYKPMIDVCGKPMIERVIENLTPKYRDHRFIFVTLSNMTDERLLNILRKPNSSIIMLPYMTQGATESALKAENLINNDERLLLSSCDQLVDIPIDDFIDASWFSDGAYLTHHATELNHSFAITKKNSNEVIKIVEKPDKVVSTHAGIGPFLYRKGSDFVSAAKEMIKDDFKVNNEYYNAPVFNWMIKRGKKVTIYEIPNKQTHMLGTPAELEEYVNDNTKTI